MPKAINLPADFFQCPELSDAERRSLVQMAQESARSLVESTRCRDGPVRWIEAGVHRGVQMYKGEARDLTLSAGGQVNYACGATTLQATLEEVVDFFDHSTTEKVKEYAATQDDWLDGVVLYSLVAPDHANNFMHQITAKWSCISMPSAIIKDRDFVTLECQDVFTDTTGRRGWVRAYQSITLACCPNLQSELGLVRGTMHNSGFVFVESEREGFLDCVFSAQVNLNGNLVLPSSLHFLGMKRRLGAVGLLGRLLKERRLGKLAFLSDLELVPAEQRTHCRVCNAKFGMMKRKGRCRRCGEVVCSSCSRKLDINLPKHGLKRIRVCTNCCESTEKEALESMSISASERHSASQASEHPPLQHYASSEASNETPRLRRDSRFDGRGPPQPPSSSASFHGRGAATNSTFYSDVDAGRPYARGDVGDYERRRQPSFRADYDRPPSRSNSFHHPPADYYSAPPQYHSDRYYGAGPERVDERYETGHAPPPRSFDRERAMYSHDREREPYAPYAPYPAYPQEYRGYPPQASGDYGRHPAANYPPHHGSYPYGGHEKTRLTDETVSTSSSFSASRAPSDRALTANALEAHTRRMGRPGPVSPRAYGPPRHVEPAPRGFGRGRAPSGWGSVHPQEQDVAYGELVADFTSDSPVVRPADDAETIVLPAVPLSTDQADKTSIRSGSHAGDRPRSVASDRRSNAPSRSAGRPTEAPFSAQMMSAQHRAEHRGFEVEDDEDDDERGSFDLDAMETPHVDENVKLDSNVAVGAENESVVQLYQRILALTKQQHSLDKAPEADRRRKDEIDGELRALYQRLNKLSM
ncbi:hypothetical protein P43SY_000681 [Pythium insidiosum]|uniref:FYVE-type domain-containing protein n=1 Tax=Pythium insidiosum TaxID=114742 RepID=A0AAD5Q446_PYTIN|nr:hypothetical protein P43SY_000681 [Pythium insidiosum]